MTIQFRCDDKERLVSYLFDETGDPDRAAIEAHLATCAACSEEVAGLTAVRRDLVQWQPPDAELGFRIVREQAPARAWWRVPIWIPTAAAAGLALAVGAALANVQIEVGHGALVLRAGWPQQAVPATAVAPVQTAAVVGAPPPVTVLPAKAGMSEQDVRSAIAALETRLRSEIAASGRQPGVELASASFSDRGPVLQQVNKLVEESERRQQRELALRLSQVVQDWETQRRTDLVHIEQGFGQIESLTGQEAARQAQTINYLVRASQRQ